MKKVAIMQPYFFPYVGYIGLIKHVDEFILFDTVQFIRHGWIERNRISKQGGDWVYIKAPLKKMHRDSTISEALIDNTQPWREKTLAQLEVYKKSAPFYMQVREVVREGLYADNIETVTQLNKACLEAVCRYLGIDTQIKIFSEMRLPIKPANAPDEWALNICMAMGDVDEYWNPPGGKSFFDASKYSNEDIALRFYTQHLLPYRQLHEGQEFIAGLSIVDLLMFNSPETINDMLEEYELE